MTQADELMARVRSLNAERQRPEPAPYGRPRLTGELGALLDELIDVLAKALLGQDDD